MAGNEKAYKRTSWFKNSKFDDLAKENGIRNESLLFRVAVLFAHERE